MKTEKRPNQILLAEEQVISAFCKATAHLKKVPATQEMQEELRQLSLPFHRKMKEFGYKPTESAARLCAAFDHQPPASSIRKPPQLVVFG
jgi:hypothetical protein